MPAKKKKLLSLIVPCFNEQESLPIFYKETSKVLNTLDVDYELILVNDGSKDDTLSIMKNLAKEDKNIVYLSFSRNFGKESAMYAGLVNANGDYVGFIDADLQHPPIYIKEMVNILLLNEYDCVGCRRVDRKGDAKIRTFLSRKFYQLINSISEISMQDGAGDYRIMNRGVANALLSIPEYNRFSKGLFGWVGYKTYWIDYENVERVAGTTSWSFTNLFKYAINGITCFSNAPLYISIKIGFLTTFLSIVYLVFIIIKYLLYSDPVQGWATTICIILFLGGIQLFCLGIIGQYLGRIYIETKNRPHFIIKESNKKVTNIIK